MYLAQIVLAQDIRLDFLTGDLRQKAASVGGRIDIKCLFYAASLNSPPASWVASCPSVRQLQAGEENSAAQLPPIN